MAVILNMDDLLEAALDSNMPGYAQFVEQAENMATALAKNLAAHLGVECKDAVWEGEAFAGLAARFGPSELGQECPQVLKQADPTGDWEPLTFQRQKSSLRPENLKLPSDAC